MKKNKILLKEQKNIVPEWKDLKLKGKELLFTVLYITNGFNAVKARKRAGYNDKTYNSAGVAGHELLKKLNIQQAVKNHINRFLGEQKGIFEHEIIKVLKTQAFYDPFDFINADGSPKFESADDIPEDKRCCIEGIDTKAFGKDATRTITTIKLVDRHRALEKLAKYITLFADAETPANLRMTEETEKKLGSILAGIKAAELGTEKDPKNKEKE